MTNRASDELPELDDAFAQTYEAENLEKLREGVRRQYGLEEVPAREQLVELAEPWRPWRTVATWFMWRSFGAVPQSE